MALGDTLVRLVQLNLSHLVPLSLSVEPRKVRRAQCLIIFFLFDLTFSSLLLGGVQELVQGQHLGQSDRISGVLLGQVVDGAPPATQPSQVSSVPSPAGDQSGHGVSGQGGAAGVGQEPSTGKKRLVV